MRALVFLQRCLVARRLFGLADAFRVLVWDRVRPPAGTRAVRPHGRAFTYRPQRDRDLVVAHFCRPLYRLHDTAEHPIRRIVDAGAHIGDETFRFRVFHPDATIDAIEADPEHAAVLRANFADDPRVTVLHRALWPTPGEVRIASGANAQESHVSAHGVLVETITVPDLLRRGPIDILKIDIEGAERALFADPACVEWLRQIPALVVECHEVQDPGITLLLADRLRATGLDWRCQIADENLVWTQSDVRWTIQREADLSHYDTPKH